MLVLRVDGHVEEGADVSALDARVGGDEEGADVPRLSDLHADALVDASHRELITDTMAFTSTFREFLEGCLVVDKRL